MKKDFLVIPIFIPHLGCPHKCVFCNQKKITGKTTSVTTKDIEETVNFFLSFKRRKKVVEVAFFGGTFTGLPLSVQESFLKVVQPYIERGDVNYIRLSTRPDYIDRDVLLFLKKYKVGVIELGVQSLVDDVLSLSQRGHTRDDIENASKLIRKYGFLLGHQIMPGLPGDTKETIMETVKRSIEMRPNMVRIYPTLVLEDTELFNMYKQGRYKPLSLEEAVRLVALSYLYYMANEIEVIRIGLQTTDEINERYVVAGPYHPNIGTLVRAQIFLWMTLYLVINVKNRARHITLFINEKDVPYFIGYKKKNLEIIKTLFPNFSKKIDKSLLRGEVVLLIDDKKYKISLVEFSKKVYKNIININEITEVMYEHI